jgi:formylglycine-generating enzyme required for sulfatase activity
MGTAMRMTKGIGGRPEPMPVSVPEALRAVVMKAMAREKEGRYARVVDLAADVDAYVGGFATSAEGAGVMRRVRLWVGRNRVLAGSAALFVVMGAGFTAKVVLEGRRASAALKELKDSAPVFAARAEDELNRGDFDAAERSARSALRLDGERGESYVVLGRVLQVREKWEEAVEVLGRAKGYGAEAGELKDFTERLVVKRKGKREDEAREELFGALRDGGRQMESVGYAKVLGEEFWMRRGEKIAEGAKQHAFAMSEAERMKRRDLSVIGELVRRLEAKMLPVPGTEILLSKTEFTVGEWKLYLRAEGYPEWQQPDPNKFMQTDEHPVVKVSWNDAMKFCEWLSKVSGKKWRLPKNEEWEVAVGKTKYPWGEYFPPKKEDGNYAILADGKDDPAKVGVDGIKGTAPVGSFKPNALGFYDLGGNVEEWMLDGFDEKNPKANPVNRGGNWGSIASNCAVVGRNNLYTPTGSYINSGFRVATSSVR